MKEIIDKLSSYNLFNYLLPGIIFVVLLKQLTSFNLVLENDFLGAFLYYFVGLVISRIGSLILEPIFKKIRLVKFSEYKDFIIASKNDDKIEVFSEINNTYRTFASLFFSLLLCILYERLVFKMLSNYNIDTYVITIGLLILFVFSYRKQTGYINKRIEKNKSK